MPYKNKEDNNEWRRQDKKKNPEKWKQKQKKNYSQFIERCRKDPNVWKKKMDKQRETRSANSNVINHGGTGHSILHKERGFTGGEYDRIVDLRRKYNL